MIMSSDECHRTLLMISQHWFRYWLGAIRQQAITWTSVDQDLQRHMASLGPNELTHWAIVMQYGVIELDQYRLRQWLGTIRYRVISWTINRVLWHSSEGKFHQICYIHHSQSAFENSTFRWLSTRLWLLHCRSTGVMQSCTKSVADSRFTPSQWETSSLCNDVSHWLSANLESAL